jgi:hypothetical protein
MNLNYLPSVNFGAADILTLSHYLDEVLLALSEPNENGVWDLFESADYMHLLLHLHLAQEFNVDYVDHMKLILRSHCNKSITAVDFGDALAHNKLTLLVINFEAKLAIGTTGLIELDMISCGLIFCARD